MRKKRGSYPADHLGQLGKGVLKDVSRSFYLTLRILPADFREPTSVGYLLARASDTLADSVGWSENERVELLETFLTVLQGDFSVKVWQKGLSLEKVENEKERVLLERLAEVFAWKESLVEWQQKAIEDVVKTIIEGQLWDVRYFDREGYVRVQDREQLLDYTYRVAGCVGEFWTKLGFGLDPDGYVSSSHKSEKEMMTLGCHYGQGLQLVNILRDVVEDQEKGRCYVPGEGAFFEAGDERVFRSWVEQAESFLQEGVEYSQALRSRRLRVATVLPARLGLRTTELLKRASWDELKGGVKISRQVVREELWQAIIS